MYMRKHTKRPGMRERINAQRKKYVSKNRDKVNQRQREAYAANKEARWAARIERDFGITGEGYKELLRKQGGTCAVCREPETVKHQNGEVKMLSVDHCHETDVVRGLLCSRCNTAIGLLQNDPERAASVARYLTVNA